tara:strand:+ start:32 stop:781 length:750 start_codon:yes stop_codon:yes gene_type:complete
MRIRINFFNGWKVQNFFSIWDDIQNVFEFEGEIENNRLLKGEIFKNETTKVYSGTFTEDGFYKKGRFFYDVKHLDKYKTKDYFDGYFQDNSCLPKFGILYYEYNNTFFGEFYENGEPYKGLRKYSNHSKYDTFDGIFSVDGNPLEGILLYRDGSVFHGTLVENYKRIIYEKGCLHMKNHCEFKYMEGQFVNNEMFHGEIVNTLGFHQKIEKGCAVGHYFDSDLYLDKNQSEMMNNFYKNQRYYCTNKFN